MTALKLPAYDPLGIAESNATSYPDKFKADNSRRWNRRLGASLPAAAAPMAS